MNYFLNLQLLADAAPSKEQGFMQTIIMIAVAFLFFYFVLLRPEQKRRKKLEQQRNSMQKGSKVTAMGIVGIIDKIQDQTVILSMVDGAKIEVLKTAVTDVHPSDKPSTSKNENVSEAESSS